MPQLTLSSEGLIYYYLYAAALRHFSAASKIVASEAYLPEAQKPPGN